MQSPIRVNVRELAPVGVAETTNGEPAVMLAVSHFEWPHNCNSGNPRTHGAVAQLDSPLTEPICLARRPNQSIRWDFAEQTVRS